MILQIPVRSDLAAYSFVVELEQRNYVMSFRWNTRAALWHMDIGTTDGVQAVSGVPLLVNTDLIGRFESDNLPPGLLMIYDRGNSGDNPGRNNLGEGYGDFLLLYEEATA